MQQTTGTYRTAEERLRRIGGDLERADRRTRALAMEHPFVVVSGALLFGYVCGRLLRNI